MPLNETTYPIIKAQLTVPHETPEAAADRLNDRLYPNTTPVPRVTMRLELKGLQDRLASKPGQIVASIFRLARAVDDQDNQSAVTELANLVSLGVITVAERTAITTWAQSQVDDPDFPKLLSWSDLNIGRPLTSSEVKVVMDSPVKAEVAP